MQRPREISLDCGLGVTRENGRGVSLTRERKRETGKELERTLETRVVSRNGLE